MNREIHYTHFADKPTWSHCHKLCVIWDVEAFAYTWAKSTMHDEVDVMQAWCVENLEHHVWFAQGMQGDYIDFFFTTRNAALEFKLVFG